MLGTATAMAQDEVPTRLLEPHAAVIAVSNPFATGFTGAIKCDLDGNLYVRPATVFGFPGSKLVSISHDGSRTVEFSPNGAPGYLRKDINDFAVGDHGHVYLLSQKCEKNECEDAILEFGSDGRYLTATTFGRSLRVARFAAFGNGLFLLTGTNRPVRSSSAKKPAFTTVPYTAVFDTSGRLIREVSLAMDEAQLPGEGRAPDEAVMPQPLQLSLTAAGEDAVYVARRTSQPTIYRVGPDGTVAHTFKVTPPTKNAWPMRIDYAGNGQLIIEFNNRLREDAFDAGHAILSLVDDRTGQRLIDYQSAPEIGLFACYVRGNFTFVGVSKEGKSEIREATPQ